MNERTKYEVYYPLIQKAREAAVNEDGGAYTFDLDKFHFALIQFTVEECMRVADEADMTRLEGPDPEDVLFVVCEQIKEHFGVKE